MTPSDITIQEITGLPHMLAQHHLIQQLNPDMAFARYRELLEQMLPNNYRMAGAFAGDTCLGLSGYWISAKLYSGKYLEIDNFVVDEASRDKGVGKLLSDWLHQEAKRNNCQTIMLDAYATNSAAHRFYFREGFIIKGYHFLKSI